MKSLDTAHDHQHGVASDASEVSSDRLPRRISRKASSSSQASTQLGSSAPYAWSFASAVNTGIHVMRKESGGEISNDAAALVSAAGASSGTALPSVLQRKFEASLGADLSSVRVHTGSESASASASVSARAYATGQDIHFGAGQYDPSSHAGEHLLAHEVAHTVQQQGGSPATQYKLEVSGANDACEVEADRAADAMVAGRTFAIGGGGGLQRKIMRDLGDETPSTAAETHAGHDTPPTSGAGTGTTPATGTGGTTPPGTGPVQTTWTLQYRGVFGGVGHDVGSRHDSTNLQVNHFNVAPDSGPATDFHGRSISPIDRVTLGAVAQPRNQGGQVTGRVAYSNRAMTLQVHRAGPDAHAIQQRILAAMQTSLVTDANAQANALLTADERARHITVTARLSSAPREVELREATYAPVAADTQMNAMITIPTVTQTSTHEEHTDEGGSQTTRTGDEHAQTDTTSSTTSQTERTQVTQELERSFNEHIGETVAQIISTITAHETTAEGHAELNGSGTASLSTTIGGDIPLAAIGSRLPSVLRFIAEVLPTLEVQINPSFQVTAGGTMGGSYTVRDEVTHNEEARRELQRVLEMGMRQVWSTQITRELSTALTTSRSQAATQTTGREDTATHARHTGTSTVTTHEQASGPPQITVTRGPAG